MEEAMGITAIVFVLIILLFSLDSTGQVKTRQQPNWLRRILRPLTWCRDSRLRRGWQRDRNPPAQGRF